MPHELLMIEEMVKNKIYHHKHLIKPTSGHQHSLCIHPLTGKLALAIHKWNYIPEMKKKWVRFKQFFMNAHHELQETMDLTVQYTGMHHSNMVRDVVAGLQEVLKK